MSADISPTHHCKYKFHSWHPSAACVGILTRPAWHCFGLFIVTETSAPHPRFDGFSRPRELVKRSSRYAPLVDLRAPGLLSEAIFTFSCWKCQVCQTCQLGASLRKKDPRNCNSPHSRAPVLILLNRDLRVSSHVVVESVMRKPSKSRKN